MRSATTTKRKPVRKAATRKAAQKTAEPQPKAMVPHQTSRLLPSTELPAYTHVPGTDTPHPYRDPRGHSYQRKHPVPKVLTADNWAENRSYLLAIDYFNYGFYWEAHEE